MPLTQLLRRRAKSRSQRTAPSAQVIDPRRLIDDSDVCVDGGYGGKPGCAGRAQTAEPYLDYTCVPANREKPVCGGTCSFSPHAFDAEELGEGVQGYAQEDDLRKTSEETDLRAPCERTGPPLSHRRAMACKPRCWPAESQDGPNGEFCGLKRCIRRGLFKMSQSRLIISRSVRD
jgi:hypothetical protein